MSHFPRVAPLTRPRRPRASSLPPLLVGIYGSDGQLVKVNEQPDPRILFCAEFNSQAAEFGMTARPILAEGGDV